MLSPKHAPIPLTPQQLVTIPALREDRLATFNLIAHLALSGPVRVIDAGNQYEAFTIARAIRRHTSQLYRCLERIEVARPFTCYQVLTLFRQTPSTPTPIIILDLLRTFYDESIPTGESAALLQQVIHELSRLKQEAAILVSLSASPWPERAGFPHSLRRLADQAIEVAPALPPPVSQLALL